MANPHCDYNPHTDYHEWRCIHLGNGRVLFYCIHCRLREVNVVTQK